MFTIYYLSYQDLGLVCQHCFDYKCSHAYPFARFWWHLGRHIYIRIKSRKHFNYFRRKKWPIKYQNENQQWMSHARWDNNDFMVCFLRNLKHPIKTQLNFQSERYTHPFCKFLICIYGYLCIILTHFTIPSEDFYWQDQAVMSNKLVKNAVILYGPSNQISIYGNRISFHGNIFNFHRQFVLRSGIKIWNHFWNILGHNLDKFLSFKFVDQMNNSLVINHT